MKELVHALFSTLANASLGIQFLDLYNRQFEQLEQGKDIEVNSFDLPAVLVQLKVVWALQAKGIQRGDCTITLHIGQELYENTDAQSPESLDALGRIFDLPQEIYLALQGLTGANFTGLVRIDSEPDADYTNLNVQRVVFKTTITDASKANTDQDRFVKLTPDLKLGKNITPDYDRAGNAVYPQPAVIP